MKYNLDQYKYCKSFLLLIYFLTCIYNIFILIYDLLQFQSLNYMFIIFSLHPLNIHSNLFHNHLFLNIHTKSLHCIQYNLVNIEYISIILLHSHIRLNILYMHNHNMNILVHPTSIPNNYLYLKCIPSI